MKIPLLTISLKLKAENLNMFQTPQLLTFVDLLYILLYIYYNTSGCGVVPADIVFILDSSGSVGASNFQKMKDFVKTMVQGFDVTPQGAEIGVVTFSDKPALQFHLNKYHDKPSTLTAIDNIRYVSGGTNTADAIKYARQTSFTAANGMRQNAAKIAIIITDGKSNRYTPFNHFKYFIDQYLQIITLVHVVI